MSIGRSYYFITVLPQKFDLQTPVGWSFSRIDVFLRQLPFSKHCPWAAWLMALERRKKKRKKNLMSMWKMRNCNASSAWQWKLCLHDGRGLDASSAADKLEVKMCSHKCSHLPQCKKKKKTHVNCWCWAGIRKSRGGNGTGRAEWSTHYNDLMYCNDRGLDWCSCASHPPPLPARRSTRPNGSFYMLISFQYANINLCNTFIQIYIYN